MASKLVILDTEVFVRVKCDFSHYQLKKLLDLPKSELYCLAITDVTDREIESKVVDQVKIYFNEALKLQKNVLSHSAFALFDLRKGDLELNTAIDSALEQYHLFKLDMNIEVITTNDVNTSDVMHLYFNLLPPFSLKKKNEFPDAISLLAITQKIKDQKSIVISGDKDWANYFENKNNFSFFNSIPEFVDKLLTDENRILSGFKEQVDLELSSIQELIFEGLINKPLIIYFNGKSLQVHEDNISLFQIDMFNIIDVEKHLFGSRKNMSYKRCNVDFNLSFVTKFKLDNIQCVEEAVSINPQVQSFNLETVARLSFGVEEYKGSLLLSRITLESLSQDSWYISSSS